MLRTFRMPGRERRPLITTESSLWTAAAVIITVLAILILFLGVFAVEAI